ncbi:MtrAB system histidine kinase MtrB, partial [Gordonia sihwensis]
QVAFQYTSIDQAGDTVPALVIGSPVESPIQGLEIYLVFPLGTEENTVSLVRGTLLTGAVVLLGLLAAIAWLVTRQVIAPLRSATRIAVRFADGRLSERMPVHGEDEFARLAVSFNDMAESLSRQINHLEEFGGLQRQFTSDVSHELRTPLTTVRMAADLLYDNREGLDPVQRRSVELLDKELNRFETLLTELLEISRHDAGMAELAAQKLDIAVPIDAAVSTVAPLAAETGSDLIIDMPTEPVMAEIDPRRVERILRNLLANAIDHGEHKPVTLTMRSDGDAVAITVRDHGIGLRPGEEKLVFNRFWRSDPSRVRRSGGTGLGLAISIEDARLHQGRLEAWGAPGEGSCFRLTLPLVRGHKLLGSPLPLKPIGETPR